MKKIKVLCCQARRVFYSFQTALLNIMMRGNATSEVMYLKFLTELSVLYLECLFEAIWEKLWKWFSQKLAFLLMGVYVMLICWISSAKCWHIYRNTLKLMHPVVMPKKKEENWCALCMYAMAEISFLIPEECKIRRNTAQTIRKNFTVSC